MARLVSLATVVACLVWSFTSALPSLGLQGSCLAGTNWDRHWKRDCGPSRYISYIHSHHSNHYEDRKFGFCCANAPAHAQCWWTNWANDFDAAFTYSCPADSYISGIESYHSNHHEDRRFKFRCCIAPGFRKSSCKWTDWVNNYDADMAYSTDHGMVLTGMGGIHSNHYEDRRFKFQQCKLTRASEDFEDSSLDEDSFYFEE